MSVRGTLKNTFMAAALAVPLTMSAAPLLAQDTAPQNDPVVQTISENEASFENPLGIGFVSPLVLLGLLSLPLLWRLSKHNPPTPRVERFPAMRLLLGLETEEMKPDTMPVWRKSLRVAAAGAVVLGLAGLITDADQPLPGVAGEPLLLVIDNGWAAGENWEDRFEAASRLMARAEREGRQVILLPTAAPEDDRDLQLVGPLAAPDAMNVLGGLKAQPWPVDHAQALNLLEEAGVQNGAAVYWVSNGLETDGTLSLMNGLQDIGDVTVMDDDYNPKTLLQTGNISNSLSVAVARSDSDSQEAVVLLATDDQGFVLARSEGVFAQGDKNVVVDFALPEDVRAQITRISIEDTTNAGAVLLVDENWRQRPVGIVQESYTGSPLLRDAFYVESALQTYAKIYTGDVQELIDQNMAVTVVPDEAILGADEIQALQEWVENGGTLVRFAGPNLAYEQDSLLPVDLLTGNRALGGSLSWDEAVPLDAFSRNSPFYGLEIADDIRIERQVVARPDAALREKTWASLADGTPLVTAEQRGEGHIVLFHVSSNAKHNWSSLPLSGTFVNMLQRIVDQSAGVTGVLNNLEALPPYQILDGQGRLGMPPPSAQALDLSSIERGQASPATPPGFYGDQTVRMAYNPLSNLQSLEPMPENLDGVTMQALEKKSGSEWMGYLLLAGLLALGADQGIRVLQGGSLTSRNRSRKTAQNNNVTPSEPAPNN